VAIFTCQAVLFDLDGVLVDSTPCVTRVWTEWALRHNLDPEHVVHVAHGQKAIETVRKVAPQLDAEREFRIIEKMELDDTDGLRLLPGAKELLSALPPERFTIVTSGTRRLATKRLQTVGLRVPAKMISADEVAHGKPHPEPYLAGAAALGFAANECLVFEDAPWGIGSARAAGAQVVAVATTYPAEELSAASGIIPSLAVVRWCGADTRAGALQFDIAEARTDFNVAAEG
jgi:sugar-phosphatase